MQDLSISEFEAIVTARVYSVLLRHHGVIKETSNRNDIALKYTIATNRVLGDFGFEDLKAIFRGRRAYIIYKPTGRIACEICIDGSYEGGMVRRSRATLMSRRGYLRSKSLVDLTNYTASRGRTIYSK